jgi:hypothetical protein
VNRKSINVCGLEAQSEGFFLFSRPRSVRDMPDIFDNSEQDGVQYFDRCVFCGIET